MRTPHSAIRFRASSPSRSGTPRSVISSTICAMRARSPERVAAYSSPPRPRISGGTLMLTCASALRVEPVAQLGGHGLDHPVGELPGERRVLDQRNEVGRPARRPRRAASAPALRHRRSTASAQPHDRQVLDEQVAAVHGGPDLVVDRWLPLRVFIVSSAPALRRPPRPPPARYSASYEADSMTRNAVRVSLVPGSRSSTVASWPFEHELELGVDVRP